MFQVLLGAFDKVIGDASEGYSEGMDQLVLLVSIMLETVAVSVSSQPDLARAILLGGENNEDWRLVDKMVSSVMSTSDLMSASRENNQTAAQSTSTSLPNCGKAAGSLLLTSPKIPTIRTTVRYTHVESLSPISQTWKIPRRQHHR